MPPGSYKSYFARKMLVKLVNVYQSTDEEFCMRAMNNFDILIRGKSLLRNDVHFKRGHSAQGNFVILKTKQLQLNHLQKMQIF